MSIYLVGDVQGCLSELSALLVQVSFKPDIDQLYLAGDLVARGPDSLATLRFIKSLGNSAKVVLGNHDLHLLSVYAGIKRVKARDKLDDLLNAADVDDLMNWLAQQPLLQKIGNSNAYMSHAGIPPQWSLKKAIKKAKKAQKKLRSKKRNYWLQSMYSDQPNDWERANTPEEKFRYTVNAFTRMRYCFTDNTLEFELKLAPSDNNNNELIPWYELSETINTTTWVFGHWATLMGNCSHTNIFALDTGCVWGHHLTLLRWHDKKTFIEQAHKVSE